MGECINHATQQHMRIIHIKEDHYKAPLSWYISTEDEFFNHIKKFGFEEEYELGCSGHFTFFNSYSVIWVDPKLPAEKYFRTLLHELLHYVISTLNRKGIPVNYENDECITYFFEKMVEKCMQINLKKYIKKS